MPWRSNDCRDGMMNTLKFFSTLSSIDKGVTHCVQRVSKTLGNLDTFACEFVFAVDFDKQVMECLCIKISSPSIF